MLCGWLLAASVWAYERFGGPTELLFCDPAKTFAGYTLFGVGSRTFLLDQEGRVCHTWPIGTNPHLLDNGHILDAAKDDPRGFQGFTEVDWDGKTVWEYTYDKDTHNQPRQISNQVVWSFRSVNSHSFFSHIGSSAQRLPNGNTFVCSDTEGHFFEVTTAGQLVWEYLNPVTRDGAVKVLGDALPMTNSVFRAYRYAADHPALKGRDLTPAGTITERAAQGLDVQPKRRCPRTPRRAAATASRRAAAGIARRSHEARLHADPAWRRARGRSGRGAARPRQRQHRAPTGPGLGLQRRPDAPVRSHPRPADADLGPLQDYYAWEWGEALLVVLDPYWFAERQRGQNDTWKRTLGQAQYGWLRHTLESGRARFTFVCIHHLVGGAEAQARGGAEAAPFYEWGGRNADGSDGFATHRPGWPLPIHALFVQTGVSIVFHGHDHLYAKQDLDGIVYQEVPQPGCPGSGKPPRSAAEYGYAKGTILGGSGHLRIKVSPRETAVDYVRTDGTVAHSYVTPAAGMSTPGAAARE